MSQTEDSELLLVRYDLRMLPSHVKPITLWAVSQWGVIGDVVLRFAELRKLFIFSDKGWLQVFSVRMYRHLWHRYWLPALDPFLTTLHTVPSTRIMAPFPDHIAYCTRYTIRHRFRLPAPDANHFRRMRLLLLSRSPLSD